MLDGIVQPFLGDPVQGDMDLGGELAFTVNLYGNREALLALRGFGELVQQVAEIGLEQGGWPELEQ